MLINILLLSLACCMYDGVDTESTSACGCVSDGSLEAMIFPVAESPLDLLVLERPEESLVLGVANCRHQG